MSEQTQPDDRGPPLPPEFLHQLLNAAVKDENFHTATVLLEHGARANHYTLCAAAERGATDLVQRMLADGVDHRGLDDFAFRIAAKNGHLETVKLLIERGVNVRALDNEAVRRAAGKDDYEMVRTLLEAGAQLEHPIPSPTGGERGPNHEGLSCGMADVLRSFGDKGWDPRAKQRPPPVCRP